MRSLGSYMDGIRKEPEVLGVRASWMCSLALKDITVVLGREGMREEW